MNIRYRFRNRKTGQVETEILSLGEIEIGCIWNAEDWEILSRDIGTGLKTKNKLTDLFEGDIIDETGERIGTIYDAPQLFQGRTYLHITRLCTPTWKDTEQKAMAAGCFYSE